MYLFLGSNTLQSYHANHSYTWLQSDNRGKSHSEFPSPGAERLMWDGLMSNQSMGLCIKSSRGLERETSLQDSFCLWSIGTATTWGTMSRNTPCSKDKRQALVLIAWAWQVHSVLWMAGHLLSSHLLLSSTINLREPPQLSVSPVLTLSISYRLTGTLFPEKLRCWLKPPGQWLLMRPSWWQWACAKEFPVEWVSGTGLVSFLLSCIFSLPDRDKMSPLCFSSSVVSLCCLETETPCVVWA